MKNILIFFSEALVPLFNIVVGGFLGIGGLFAHLMILDMSHPPLCMGFWHPFYLHIVLMVVPAGLTILISGYLYGSYKSFSCYLFHRKFHVKKIVWSTATLGDAPLFGVEGHRESFKMSVFDYCSICIYEDKE